MKVALVHDYLVDAGGAERALLELQRIFPDAPIFTSVYDPATAPAEFRASSVHTASLLRPVATKRRYKLALPLYPLVFAGRRLRGYDLVVSSASAFAKSVGVEAPTRHVCYCYTPPRFVWQLDGYARQEQLGLGAELTVRALRPYFKMVDRRTAASVDRFVAISETVRGRIRHSYGRDADVVPPPVDVERFHVGDGAGEYFLVVSRLNRYKRVDLVIEAFNRLGLPLVVVGTGADEQRLRALAGPTIRFAGRVPDGELATVYGRASALVLAGEEDFGLTPLEANASGRPVIAYAAGGALETVVADQTGVLFAKQSVESLIDAVQRFQQVTFDGAGLRRHAERFSCAFFRSRMLEIFRRVLSEPG